MDELSQLRKDVINLRRANEALRKQISPRCFVVAGGKVIERCRFASGCGGVFPICTRCFVSIGPEDYCSRYEKEGIA